MSLNRVSNLRPADQYYVALAHLYIVHCPHLKRKCNVLYGLQDALTSKGPLSQLLKGLFQRDCQGQATKHKQGRLQQGAAGAVAPQPSANGG